MHSCKNQALPAYAICNPLLPEQILSETMISGLDRAHIVPLFQI